MITFKMCLSANSNICISSGSVLIDFFIYSLDSLHIQKFLTGNTQFFQDSVKLLENSLILSDHSFQNVLGETVTVLSLGLIISQY